VWPYSTRPGLNGFQISGSRLSSAFCLPPGDIGRLDVANVAGRRAVGEFRGVLERGLEVGRLTVGRERRLVTVDLVVKERVRVLRILQEVEAEAARIVLLRVHGIVLDK